MSRDKSWFGRAGRMKRSGHAVGKGRRRWQPALLELEDRRLPSTFTVTSTADTAPATDPAKGTLRWAVEQADDANSPSTIAFKLGSSKTILLTQGTLTLSNTREAVTIEGPGAGALSVSGGGKTQVFLIDSGVAATITGLTITDGSSAYGGGIENKGQATLTDCVISKGNGGVYKYGTPSPDGCGGVENYGTATLTGCTISSNSSEYGPGGFANYGTATLVDCTIAGNTGQTGGGIYNEAFPDKVADLTLDGCTISGNHATWWGAGLFQRGKGDASATLSDCIISDNSAANFGGGLYFGTGNAAVTGCTISGNAAWSSAGFGVRQADATLVGCTISGNSAEGWGGGLYAYKGDTSLTGCTISGNSAGGDGGGLLNMQADATLTLVGCTISGNSASVSGGGLQAYKGDTSLTGCTISGNSAGGYGGGLLSQYGTIALTDTIVAGNTAGRPATPSDVEGNNGSVVTGSYDLIGPGGSGEIEGGQDGNIVLTSLSGLGLAPLGNYGGPTETMALLPGGAAIGMGTPADLPGTSTPITSDQRGAPIPASGVDIGAFQEQGYTLAVASGSPQAADAGKSFAHSLEVALTEDFAKDPLPGATILFQAPASGAGAKLGAGSAVTNSNGQASVKATADSTGGTYTVTASAAGVAPVSFSLTNLVQPAFTVKNQTITYGTDSVTVSGSIAAGSQVPGGDVAVTLDGVTQDAAIATNDQFSTTFTFTTPLGVGASPYTMSYAFAAGGYFLGAKATSKLTVNPASLTVTATDKSMIQGNVVPALAYTYTGQVAGGQIPTFKGALATTATSSSTPGKYAITQGTLAATGDYTIGKFLAGTLTVKADPLTIPAPPEIVIPGGGAAPGLTSPYAGLVDGDGNARFTDPLATTARSSSVVGNDAITRGTPVASGDSTIVTFDAGMLSIEASPTRGAAAGATTGGLADAAIDGLVWEAEFAESLGTIPPDGNRPKSAG